MFIKAQEWDARRHYKVGHNKFSDWTQGEYEKLLGYAAPMDKKAKTFDAAAPVDKKAKTFDAAAPVDKKAKTYDFSLAFP